MYYVHVTKKTVKDSIGKVKTIFDNVIDRIFLFWKKNVLHTHYGKKVSEYLQKIFPKKTEESYKLFTY